jgi:hypothetical protein
LLPQNRESIDLPLDWILQTVRAGIPKHLARYIISGNLINHFTFSLPDFFWRGYVYREHVRNLKMEALLGNTFQATERRHLAGTKSSPYSANIVP